MGDDITGVMGKPLNDAADITSDRHAERVAAAERRDFDRTLGKLAPDPEREQEIEQEITGLEYRLAARFDGRRQLP